MTDEQREGIDEIQSFIVSELGVAGTLDAVIKQLDYPARLEIFAEIARVYGLNI